MQVQALFYNLRPKINTNFSFHFKFFGFRKKTRHFILIIIYKTYLLTQIITIISIKIKAVALKNPQDPTAAPRYYAKPVNQGELSLDDLSKTIAKMSTVSMTDVYAVLIGLIESIPDELKQGKIVRLGKLGSFSISLSSDPSDNAEDVSINNVKKLRLNFRPSQELKRKVEAFPVAKLTE